MPHSNKPRAKIPEHPQEKIFSSKLEESAREGEKIWGRDLTRGEKCFFFVADLRDEMNDLLLFFLSGNF